MVSSATFPALTAGSWQVTGNKKGKEDLQWPWQAAKQKRRQERHRVMAQVKFQ